MSGPAASNRHWPQPGVSTDAALSQDRFPRNLSRVLFLASSGFAHTRTPVSTWRVPAGPCWLAFSFHAPFGYLCSSTTPALSPHPRVCQAGPQLPRPAPRPEVSATPSPSALLLATLSASRCLKPRVTQGYLELHRLRQEGKRVPATPLRAEGLVVFPAQPKEATGPGPGLLHPSQSTPF